MFESTYVTKYFTVLHDQYINRRKKLIVYVGKLFHEESMAYSW